jgi:hypothetical protein
MRERARQPVDADHDQRIAAAEATEQLRQLGAATVGAAGGPCKATSCGSRSWLSVETRA